MTHFNHPDDDQPDFHDDKLADLIVHKDDEPLFDEPGDTGEKKPIEEWTGNGVNHGNCWFPIHFTYNGKNYTADVQQKAGVSKEYQVSGVNPYIDHLPDPFVVAEHFKDATYEFPVNESYYPHEFGETVLKAIEYGSNLRKDNAEKQA